MITGTPSPDVRTSSPSKKTKRQRQLFNPAFEFGIQPWPMYKLPEVAIITGIGADKMKDLLQDEEYGAVRWIVKHKPGRRRWRMMLVYQQTLLNFMRGITVK